jgi:hypothetical protein
MFELKFLCHRNNENNESPKYEKITLGFKIEKIFEYTMTFLCHTKLDRLH